MVKKLVPAASEQELIALCSGPFEDKAGPGRLLPGEIPGILYICTMCCPLSAVPSILMPLPSRNTSAGRPVVLDTALLPSSFLPAKETRVATEDVAHRLIR